MSQIIETKRAILSLEELFVDQPDGWPLSSRDCFYLVREGSTLQDQHWRLVDPSPSADYSQFGSLCREMAVQAELGERMVVKEPGDKPKTILAEKYLRLWRDADLLTPSALPALKLRVAVNFRLNNDAVVKILEALKLHQQNHSVSPSKGPSLAADFLLQKAAGLQEGQPIKWQMSLRDKLFVPVANLAVGTLRCDEVVYRLLSSTSEIEALDRSQDPLNPQEPQLWLLLEEESAS